MVFFIVSEMVQIMLYYDVYSERLLLHKGSFNAKIKMLWSMILGHSIAGIIDLGD